MVCFRTEKFCIYYGPGLLINCLVDELNIRQIQEGIIHACTRFGSKS